MKRRPTTPRLRRARDIVVSGKAKRQPARKSQPPAASALIKLSPPRLAGVYQRRRLFKELDRLWRHAVSWIGAPGGSGKTTLVASYLQARQRGCLWYQMDAGDADLASFFHYLALAVQRAAPRTRRSLPRFTAEYLADPGVFARNFFRAVGARLPVSTVLVFDNAQEAGDDARFWETLRAGIEELASCAHVVLISRSEPPEAFARLRANRQLACLDSRKLALREEESRALARLLTRGPGAPSSTRIAHIHQQCEGWMAGLILLLDGAHIAPERGETSEPCGTQALFDYFASEVFAHRPAALRDFLMQTALFPGFTEEMAQRQTGDPGTRALLDGLVRHHHFTERHKEPHSTYQYHPLFREFLREQAHAAWGAEGVAQRRRAAAAILEQLGHSEQALALYLNAGDANAAMRLILASAPGLAEIGRFGALALAIAQLPAALVARQPWLQFWQGTCRLVTDPLAARACFESAYRAFRGAGDVRGSYLAWSGIVDSFVFFWGDFTDLRAWIAEFGRLRRAFPEFPELAVEERTIYAIFTAHVFADPEWDRIGEWATRAEHLARKGADPSLRIMTVASLGLYLPWLGEFARYEALMQTARGLARSEAAAPLARLNVLGIESSNALLNGDPAHALAVAHEAADFAAASGVHILNRATFANIGFACAHLGDLAAADIVVEQYKKALKPESRLDEAQWFYLAGYVDVLRGDLLRAEERCRAALCLAQGAGTPTPLAMCQMLLARVLAECGQLDEAAALIGQAHAFVRTLRSHLYEFECWVVHAWIALRAGDSVECIAQVRRAFALAERYGIKSYAMWDPAVMAELCRIALEHDVHVSTVRRLIRSRGLAPSAAARALDAWPWPVKILTFGRFELLVNDRPVRSSTKAQKKPLELLQVLVALGGQAVPEEHLSEVLWPDSDGDAAHRAFDTTLHRLRKLLGCEQAVSVVGSRISLDARYVWADIRAFEHGLAQADKSAPGPLADALLLYQGPFLGRDTTKWALPMRERMRSMFLRGIERLSRIYDESARPHEVIECYRRAIEVDPLAETLYRRLMLHYGQRNQHSEALSTYGRLHAMLASQLGLKPSAESRELYERLRREASA